MKYYSYCPDADRYVSYYARNTADDSALRFFDSTPRGANWQSITLATLNADGAPTDFPSLMGPTPLFSARAWEVLAPLIRGSVEALPVHDDSHCDFFAIHVMSIIEGALDVSKSEAIVNPYSQSVSRIDRYCLDTSMLKEFHIWKLRETRGLMVYISEEFVATAHAAKLRGLEYLPLDVIE